MHTYVKAYIAVNATDDQEYDNLRDVHDKESKQDDP